MVKTIENITAQSVKIGALFATTETAKNVFKLITTCKNENMRNTAIIILGHVSRINFSIVQWI